MASGGSAVEVSYSMVCIEKGFSNGAVRESRRLVSCVAQPEGAGECSCVFLPRYPQHLCLQGKEQ